MRTTGLSRVPGRPQHGRQRAPHKRQAMRKSPRQTWQQPQPLRLKAMNAITAP